MTELSVILGLNLAAVALVSALLRWVFDQDDAPADARGLITAMRSAVATFRARQAKRSLMVLTGVTGAAALCAHRVSTLPGAATHIALGCLLGGALASFVGQLVGGLGPRAARATASGLGGASASLLVLALRGAAALALATELAISLLVVAILAACLAIHGADTLAWLPAARVVLTGVALGSVGVNAVSHFSGSALSGAAEAGRYQLDPATATRFRLEARSPAMVVSAIGPELGSLTVSAGDLLNLSLLCHLGPLAMVLATLDPTSANALTLVVGCVLMRTCGVLASGVSLWSLRIDDPDDPLLAVFRGQLATAAMAGFATVGVCRWLWPGAAFSGAVGMSLLGVLAQTVLAFAAWSWVQRGSRSLARIREAAQSSAVPASSLGLGFSSVMAALVLLALVALLSIGAMLAIRLEVPGGLLFSFALCLSGFCTSLAFSLTLASGEPVIESACGLASLGPDGARPHGVARLGALDFVASALGSMGSLQFIGAWTVLGAGLSFLCFSGVVSPEGVGTPEGIAVGGGVHTLPAVSALFGAGFVLVLVGLSMALVARATTAGATEVQRQLRASSGEPHASAIPKDFSPSYRDLLDRVSQAALSGGDLPAIAGSLVPLLVGILAALLLDPAELHLAVGWFFASALLVAVSLGAVGALSAFALKGAHRHSRAASSAQQLALNHADLFAHLAGSPLALASRLALSGVAATGLVLVGVVH